MKQSKRAVREYTIPDIIITFQKYMSLVDFDTFNTQETDALECLIDFWMKQDVSYYETMDVDKFYDIKQYHTILNSKYK